MSHKHLGDTIDLHAGGVDLLFPHHENEIAQSEGCTGHTFANHWYHTEHLLVDGKKMSKSLGNLYTLEDLKAKGFSAMAVRYTLLSGHPRKQLNFTLDSVHAAEKALKTLATFQEALPTSGGDASVFEPVLTALREDMNTPAALGELFKIVNLSAAASGADKPGFEQVMAAFGLNPEAAAAPEVAAPAEVTTLAEKRWAAKQSKDWPAADTLRGEIQAAGWQMLDRKDDPDLYVRRSVANHIGDIAKDHPALAFEICERWLAGASAERKWIIRHAVRHPAKSGVSAALRLRKLAA
jgi:cysteinyl-tRNA synthetase